MKEINKLVDLVTHGLKSNFGVIDLSGQVKNPGKEQQLYNGVLGGKFPDDQVTAKGMYNANIYDQRFRMLKSRLRYKLYDLLYHIDFELPQYSFTVQKKLECKANLNKARILFEMGEFAMAEKQYNKVIVLATDCQFTTDLIEAHELKRKVLAKEFKPTEFDLTIGELQSLRKLEGVEKEAEDIFLNIELLLSKSIHSRNVSGEEAKKACDKLQSLYKETNSYNIYEYWYELNVWLYSIDSDFSGLIKFLEKAQKDILEKGAVAQRFDVAKSHIILAKSHLAAGDYQNGISEVKKGFDYLDKSMNEWFELSEIQFLLYVHNQDYNGANKVLSGVLKNPNFNRSDLNIISRWKIFKIYLNFAIPELAIQKRIRFYDIYESSEFYFKELKGYRITLQLLEFMHLTNKDNSELANKKLDDLESYFYKHLNDPGKNQREKQLLKMIKVLRSSGYDVEQTESKVTTYFEKMSSKRAVNAFADFEIIPYEDLWPMVLKVVSKRANVLS